MTILVASNNDLEEETRQAEVCVRKVIAEKKLTEFDVEIEDKDNHDNAAESKNPDDLKDPDDWLSPLGNTSHWVELARKEEVGAVDLAKSVCGNEFACLHNRDSSDVMNQAKFKRFILKHINNDVPFSWYLLDDPGSCVVE